MAMAKTTNAHLGIDEPHIVIPENPAADTVPATPSPRRPSGPSGARSTGIKSRLAYIRGRGALEIGVIFLIVQAACITWSLIDPAGFPYLSGPNLAGVLTQSIPVLAILTIGVGILMVAGEFDLSLGANLTFSALVYVHLYNIIHGSVAFLAAIAVGTVIALINGIIVTRFRIPSFIATLGMGFFWTGAALFYNGTSSARMEGSELLKAIFTLDFGGFRGQVLWLIVIGAAAWIIMHRHKLGNHIIAVGGNQAAAKAISINPVRIKLVAFGILGALTAFAGILIAVRTESIQPGSGEPFTLLAVSAAVVGGTSLTGGKGSVLGMVLGAALILTVQNMLQLAGAPGYYLQLFVGLIIVVAAVFNRLMEGKAS
jgi:simple sugar transport system permease protein